MEAGAGQALILGVFYRGIVISGVAAYSYPSLYKEQALDARIAPKSKGQEYLAKITCPYNNYNIVMYVFSYLPPYTGILLANLGPKQCQTKWSYI